MKISDLKLIKSKQELSDTAVNSEYTLDHKSYINQDKYSSYSNKMSNTSNIKSNYNNVGGRQGEKIQSLKSQIEKQMKAYAKQEEYEEMLKLIKKLNLISNDKWQELETEVDKLDYSDVEYKSSAAFLTDDEIAVLASEINTPYCSKSVNEIIELSRRNSG